MGRYIKCVDNNVLKNSLLCDHENWESFSFIALEKWERVGWDPTQAVDRTKVIVSPLGFLGLGPFVSFNKCAP